MLLGACAGSTADEKAVIFAGDLLKSRAERCAEAWEIVADLEASVAPGTVAEAVVAVALLIIWWL